MNVKMPENSTIVYTMKLYFDLHLVWEWWYVGHFQVEVLVQHKLSYNNLLGKVKSILL